MLASAIGVLLTASAPIVVVELFALVALVAGWLLHYPELVALGFAAVAALLVASLWMLRAAHDLEVSRTVRRRATSPSARRPSASSASRHLAPPAHARRYLAHRDRCAGQRLPVAGA